MWTVCVCLNGEYVRAKARAPPGSHRNEDKSQQENGIIQILFYNSTKASWCRLTLSLSLFLLHILIYDSKKHWNKHTYTHKPIHRILEICSDLNCVFVSFASRAPYALFCCSVCCTHFGIIRRFLCLPQHFLWFSFPLVLLELLMKMRKAHAAVWSFWFESQISMWVFRSFVHKMRVRLVLFAISF